MITARPSYITRICAELLRNSRRTGKQRNTPLKGGAELVVKVQDGMITLTIKRPNKPVGMSEIETFRRHCNVPADAEILTPLEPREQLARDVGDVPWFFVTLRWPDPTSTPGHVAGLSSN
jgi:hypothetical protein